MERYDRREFIKMSLATFCGLTLTLPSVVAYAKKANAKNGYSRSDEPINWDAFIERVSKLAEAQFAPSWNQEAYVQQIQRIATRLSIEDPHLAEPVRRYKNRKKDWPDSEVLYKNTFQVYLIT